MPRLFLVILVIYLTGCSNKSLQTSQSARCSIPQVQVVTNADLASAALEYRAALVLCNAVNGFNEVE